MSDTRVLATARITRPHPFALTPGAEEREVLADEMGIRGIRKLMFKGSLSPTGENDIELRAELGATIVQDCVVTGAPVITRIDVAVLRRYLADMDEPEGDEVEMPEDETAEPLPVSIDLAQVMSEALALELPPWPRAEGVDPVDLSVTEPGQSPMTDDDARPFAGLKALRDRLTDDGETDR